MKLLRSILIGLFNVLALAMCPFAGAQTVTLDVKFKLTDIDYKPLSDVPVRVVFGCDKDWQSPDAGHKFNTDAKGEAQFTTTIAMDKRWRRIPTNFIDSLLSTPKLKEHLMAAADLDYMNFHSLYAVEIIYFGSDVLQDDFSLYAPDEKGEFTHRIQPRDYALIRPDLKGLILRGPGFEPWDYMLQPAANDPTHQHWTLSLAFKRTPPPIKY